MNLPSTTAQSGVDFMAVTQPATVFRPTPLWSWNEIITPDEARRQVRQMAQGGLGGAFIHVRVGLITPYMGEDFFSAIAAALDEARTLGLKLHLYDEDRWPSGWGGGAVSLRDTSFRVKWLLRATPDMVFPPDADLTLLAEDAAGMRYYRYVSPLGQVWFNGTTYGDLMDQRAMQTFIEVAYEPYAARFGADFGDLIPTIFTDEPSITFLPAYANVPRGMLFWTDALPAQFRTQHGYDLLPHVASLFDDVGDYSAIRTDYYRTCAWLLEHHYTKQIGAWCREHGIAFTGHFMREDTLTGNLAWDANAQPSYRHFDWPGIDHLGRQVNEVITGLGCRSTVNQYGKARMMSELYGCGGQHLSFADRKWIAEQQIILGVNFLVPHLTLYTMAGERKRDYPCNLWYQQPWWPHNTLIDTYLARLCALMAQGEMVPEFLVLHPQESLYPLRRPPAADQESIDEYHRDDAERIQPIDTGFRVLSQQLLGWQRTFDYGDETVLADEGVVEVDGPVPLLRVGAMTYPLVVLPALASLRGTTLALLEHFAEAGGLVVATAQLPTLIDGRTEQAERLSRFITRHVRRLNATNLEDALAALRPPFLQFTGDGPRQWLWHHHRRVGAQQVILLVNLSRAEAIAGTLNLQTSEKSIRRLDLLTQTVAEIGSMGKALPLHLAPGESTLLLLGEGESAPFTAEAALLITAPDVIEPLTEWIGERLDDNTLTLDNAAFQRGDEPWHAPCPLTALQDWLNTEHYHGPLTLAFAFESEVALPDLRLVVEHPERCVIRINGVVVAYDGLPFWRDIRWLPIAVGAHITPGANRVELHYAEFRYGDALSVTDQARRYGTEIEALYLVGNFSVTVQAAETLTPIAPPDPTPPWSLEAISGPFCLTAPHALAVGDLVWQGLPFYAGRVAFRSTITLIEAPVQPTWLTFAELSVPVVEVRINGTQAGLIGWQPYRLEIGPWLHAGANQIEVILWHSLRNLLGPHHHVQGEPYWVGPDSFRGKSPTWAHEMITYGQSDDWRDSYAVTPFGLLSEVHLDIRQP